MREIIFHKMQALGNDFVIINAANQQIAIENLPIPTLSHRQIGIGFDQLILVEKSNQADRICRFFNADGSEAEQCGNGLRCVARLLHQEYSLKKNLLLLETKAGVMPVKIVNYDEIIVNMGMPTIQKVPLAIPYDQNSLNVYTLSLGNPHAIVKIDAINHESIISLEKSISKHSQFQNGINIGFVEVTGKHQLKLRTFERGVGETFSCGSNACAAVVTAIQQHWVEGPVFVELPYGKLHIDWQPDSSVMLEGPAEYVYQGTIKL